MSTRGQRWTPTFRQPVYYRDFSDDFRTNPTSGSLATVTNVESIEQSITNLVLTPTGSRPGRCSVGSKVQSMLFDLGTPGSIDALEASIKDVIDNFEPRATAVTVSVDKSTVMNNAVSAKVTYRPINQPQVETINLSLVRAR